MSSLIRSVTILAIIVGFSGCGTTGKTSPFVLALDLPQGQVAVSDVRIASAAMDPDGAILRAVRVKPWGKFEPDDLRNIEQSLRDTIAPHLAGAARVAAPRLDIHVMIRRYVVAVSNTGGAVLATVAWAASGADGKLVHREEFYAADAVYFVGTIGGLKDAVHQAIVRRIATTALALASGPDAAARRPTIFENTYPSFEAAAAELPQTMVSMGNPALAASPVHTVSVIGILTPSGVSKMQWDVSKPSREFDWTGYLTKLYAGK